MMPAAAEVAVSVRVVEVIPGKTCIGLEIPNEQREIVALSDILKSEVYERSASHLTMALGKDIAGDIIDFVERNAGPNKTRTRGRG